MFLFLYNVCTGIFNALGDIYRSGHFCRTLSVYTDTQAARHENNRDQRADMFIQSLVNGFGSGVIAGYSAAIKLNTFAVTSFTTLANGLSTFTAQNIGAAKPEKTFCLSSHHFILWYVLS